MPVFRRGLLVAAVAAVALSAVPAAGAATRATVLATGPHSLRVVTAAHEARTYRVAERLPRGLRLGAHVSFATRGRDALRVRVLTGRERVVDVHGVAFRPRTGAYAARVVARLADGAALVVDSGAFALAGFAPGLALDVQVVTAPGGATNVVVRADDPRCGATCPLALEGRVTAAGPAGVTVDPGDGGAARTFAAADPALVEGVRAGDAVVVFGHASADGDVADRLVMAQRAAA
jgi:hypothetical protein